MRRRTFLQTLGGSAASALIAPLAATAQTPPPNEFTIRNAFVLTMDPALGDFRKGDIHVRDGAIVAVGEQLAGAGASIDGAGFIALPGLVDTHQHMWTSVFRGLVGESAEVSYFAARAKLGPLFTPAHMRAAIRLAMTQALNSGVTTSNNMHHNVRSPAHADATIQAQLDCGQRGVFSYGVAELQSKANELDFEDIARIKRAIDSGLGGGLVNLGAFLRSPSETSDVLFRAEYQQARRLDLLISMDGGRDQTGGPGIRRLSELDCLGPKMLLVHTPGTEQADRRLLATKNVSISSSPFTEMAGIAMLPPAVDMANDGVNVSLSIDTTGAPNDSNMFAIARVILNLGRVATGNPFGFNYKTALQMATINGARALGLADKIGSLTPGKRADLILVRTDGFNMSPAPDLNPYRLLLAAQSEDVDTVIVDGRIVKQNRAFAAIDAPQIVRDAADALTDLRRLGRWP